MELGLTLKSYGPPTLGIIPFTYPANNTDQVDSENKVSSKSWDPVILPMKDHFWTFYGGGPIYHILGLTLSTSGLVDLTQKAPVNYLCHTIDP